MKKKVVVAVTGASGAIYAKLLFKKITSLESQIESIGVVFSKYAKEVWKHELKDESYNKLNFPVYDTHDFFAPFASGSAGYDTMLVCPCSMGTLGRIAAGVSNDLITRAADVMLKERQKLILMPRELPYSLIQINNMKTITEAGGIICPASPSFYSQPSDIQEAVQTVVDRILDLAGFDIHTYKWGEK